MTSAIRLNHLTKEILISKSFAKAAMNPTSTEYKDLAEVMANHPDYAVNQRVIKQNAHKETYAGLTYDYMRDYIILHSTSEEALEYCIQHYVDRGNTREHAVEFIAWYPEEKIFETYDIIKREEKEYGKSFA